MKSIFFASPQVTEPYGSDLYKKIRTRLGHAWAPLSTGTDHKDIKTMEAYYVFTIAKTLSKSE